MAVQRPLARLYIRAAPLDHFVQMFTQSAGRHRNVDPELIQRFGFSFPRLTVVKHLGIVALIRTCSREDSHAAT